MKGHRDGSASEIAAWQASRVRVRQSGLDMQAAFNSHHVKVSYSRMNYYQTATLTHT